MPRSARTTTFRVRSTLATTIRAVLVGSVWMGANASATQTPIELDGLNGATGTRLDGIAGQSRTGRAVAMVGDVNGDGIDDLAIGAPRLDGAGAVHVVFGRTGTVPAAFALSQLDGNNGFRISGAAAGDRLGFATAAAGDINGDGIDDVLIGAYRADPEGRSDAGAAYVVFGRAGAFPANLGVEQLDGSDGFRLAGVQDDARAGQAVVGLGDFNGDGRDDLAVGALFFDGASTQDAGAAFVVFGRDEFPPSLDLDALDGSDGIRFDGAASGDVAGQTLAGGDVNGDGRADLLVGVGGASPWGRERAGSTHIVFGAARSWPAALGLDAVVAPDGFPIHGAEAGHASSVGLAAVDVNGDALDDVIVGSVYAAPGGLPDAGSVHVVFGRADDSEPVDLAALDEARGFRIDGEASGSYTGVSVASAGDVDGDGRQDLLLGAPGGGDPASAGRAYIVHGRDAFPASVALAELRRSEGAVLDGLAVGDYSGIAVASAGDFNTDGFDDVLVGASFRSSAGLMENGVGYLVFGPLGPLFGDGFESKAVP